jgi:hypothetical protein
MLLRTHYAIVCTRQFGVYRQRIAQPRGLLEPDISEKWCHVTGQTKFPDNSGFHLGLTESSHWTNPRDLGGTSVDSFAIFYSPYV